MIIGTYNDNVMYVFRENVIYNAIFWFCDADILNRPGNRVCSMLLPAIPSGMPFPSINTRECWMIYRGTALLEVLWFGSSATPSHPPRPSLYSTGEAQEDWEKETTCWREGGEGVGEELNYTTQESLASINSPIFSD